MSKKEREAVPFVAVTVDPTKPPDNYRSPLLSLRVPNVRALSIPKHVTPRERDKLITETWEGIDILYRRLRRLEISKHDIIGRLEKLR